MAGSLADAKVHANWTDNLVARAVKDSSMAWPLPIVEMFVGLISEAEMVAKASNDQEKCDALFFAGRSGTN
jgi:hypothetical protein